MIPQKQRIFGGGKGDCMRACILSILEVPFNDSIPSVTEHGPTACEKWLAQFGLRLGYDQTAIWRESYWIASVKSKNIEDGLHAIVMKGHKVAFDPSTKKRYRKGLDLLQDRDNIVHGGYWFEVSDARLLHKLKEYREQR